jgi:hypothetical protein
MPFCRSITIKAALVSSLVSGICCASLWDVTGRYGL